MVSKTRHSEMRTPCATSWPATPLSSPRARPGGPFLLNVWRWRASVPPIIYFTLGARALHQGPQRARAAFLRGHPLCAGWGRVDEGRVTPAIVVDYIKPHRGDRSMFWNRPIGSRCARRAVTAWRWARNGGFGRTPISRTRWNALQRVLSAWRSSGYP